MQDIPNQDELVSAILDGAFETPLWSTFLARLRELTCADFSTLIFRPPGRPLGEALHLFSGEAPTHQVEDVYKKFHSSLDFLSDLEMEEGRVYPFDELYPLKEPRYAEFFNDVIVQGGITASLMVRVMEPDGVSAWLAISCRKGDFGCRDEAIIKMIVPVLRGTLRHYVALERERFAATVMGDAMRRLHFGWMALDAQGNVIEHDPEAGRVLAQSGVLSKGPGGRLIVQSPQLRPKLSDAVQNLASNPQARARAFTLNQDPWLDMLLMPALHNRLSANSRAAIIAYVHGDSWHATDRCEQLTQLFGLTPSEARLALALSRGMTISQAADSLGIKIETARKCSKLIYAKTGAGGLPDLVRIVMRSVLALAPKD